MTLVRQNRLREAEPALREAVTLRRSYQDSTAITRLWDERHYGDLLLRLGRVAQAESVLVPAFRASGPSPSARPVHADLARVLVSLYDRSGNRTVAHRYAADTAIR